MFLPSKAVVSSTVPPITGRDSEGLVYALFSSILRDTLMENIPFWLQKRLRMILTTALFYFGLLDPVRLGNRPPHQSQSQFWTLLCLTQNQEDAARVLLKEVTSAVADVEEHQEKESAKEKEKDEKRRRGGADVLQAFLGADSWCPRLEALLKEEEKKSVSERNGEDINNDSATTIKELFFLMGTALLEDDGADAEGANTTPSLVLDCVTLLVQTIQTQLSLHKEEKKKSSVSASVLRNALACFTECVTQCGVKGMTKVLGRLDTSLSVVEVVSSLYEGVFHWYVERLIHKSKGVVDPNYISSDIVCTFLLQLAEIYKMLRYDEEKEEGNKINGTTVNDAVCQSLHLSEKVKQVVSLLSTLHQKETTVAPSTDLSHDHEDGGSQDDGLLLLQYAASALLHALLTPLRPYREAYEAVSTSTTKQQTQGLPIGPVTPFNTHPCPPSERGGLSLSVEESQSLLTAVMELFHTRQTSAKRAGEGSVLPRLDRCLYESLFVLCLPLLNPSIATTTTTSMEESKTWLDSFRSFCLHQAETCWSVNTPAVFDLLSVVILLENHLDKGPMSLKRNKEIIQVLFSHVNDVGAKLQNRTMVLTYCSLSYLLLRPSSSDRATAVAGVKYVVNLLQKVLTERKEESDRNYYLVAVTAAVMVLCDPLKAVQDPTKKREKEEEEGEENRNQTFPYFQDLLLQCVLFFNSNRDEEENESTLTTTEAILQHHFPPSLAQRYPPTVRLSSVARAMGISVLLLVASKEPAVCLQLMEALLRLNFEVFVGHGYPEEEEDNEEEEEGNRPVVVMVDSIVKEPCMPNSETHRSRLRLWQFITALQPILLESQTRKNHDKGDTDYEAKLQALFVTLLDQCLPLNNSGSVRHYMEVYAVRFLKERPSYYALLSQRLANYNLRPQVGGSFTLIAGHALLQYEARQMSILEALMKQPPQHSNDDDGKTDRVYDTLFPRLLQQSSSHQHLLRIIADIGIHQVSTARRQRRDAIQQFQKSGGVYSLPDTAEVSSDAAAIVEYIEKAPEQIKFREKHEGMLFFDLDEVTHPRSVFCVKRKEANTLLQESLPCSVFDRVLHLEGELQCLTAASGPTERSRIHCWAQQMQLSRVLAPLRSLPYIPHSTSSHRTHPFPDYPDDSIDYLRSEVLPEGSVLYNVWRHQHEEDGLDVVQKKVTSWWDSEVYSELNPRSLQGASARRHRTSLIVVGSLLENPVNLAGLCRCGDIFAIEKIIVPDRAMFQHPHFIAAARSAELWIDWEVVSPSQLADYLSTVRREGGYTIVGIEQTSGSVSMESFQFPEKTVVVLGAEGKGVPATILPLLDVCVEIPQYGLIRSLNVHVTGALVMYEYARQFLMNGNPL